MPFGENTTCEAEVSFPETDIAPISIDKSKGVILGDETTGMSINLGIYCTNSTVERELALNLDLGIHAVANVTWDNFVYWLELSEAKCVSAVATSPTELNYHNW